MPYDVEFSGPFGPKGDRGRIRVEDFPFRPEYRSSIYFRTPDQEKPRKFEVAEVRPVIEIDGELSSRRVYFEVELRVNGG